MKTFLTLAILGAGGFWLYRHLKKDTIDMKPQRTPLAPEQARDTLEEAFQIVFKRSPSAQETAVLLAQSAHETAKWTKMYNWNWGGIKATKNQASTKLTTKEGEGSFERTISANFAAYGNALSGAKEWLGLLSRKYQAALARAAAGDPAGYAEAIKKVGYFTGSLPAYAASMSRYYAEFMADEETEPETIPAPEST